MHDLHPVDSHSYASINDDECMHWMRGSFQCTSISVGGTHLIHLLPVVLAHALFVVPCHCFTKTDDPDLGDCDQAHDLRDTV